MADFNLEYNVQSGVADVPIDAESKTFELKYRGGGDNEGETITKYVKSVSTADNTITFVSVENKKEKKIEYTPDVSDKVDKVSKATVVYGTDGYKKQTTFPINVDAVAWSVAYRNAKGQLNVIAPTEDTNAVNLKYLNEQLEKVEVETISLTGTLEIPAMTYSGTLTKEQFEKLVNNKNLLLTIQVNGSDYAKAFVNSRMYDIPNNLITATCSFIDSDNNETKYSLYIDGTALTFKGGIIATDLSVYRTSEEQDVIDNKLSNAINEVDKKLDDYRTNEVQDAIDEKLVNAIGEKLDASQLTYEEFTFNLEDGKTITKKVAIWQ